MNDLLEIYEREEAEARAKVCPVCNTPYAYEPPNHHGDRRIIQILTGPDTWDSYACPSCRPDEFPTDAKRNGDDDYWTQRMLKRAARDRAAGRRLTREEHRAASAAENQDAENPR